MKLTDDERRMVEENIRLVHFTVRRFFHHDVIPYEDMVQIGCIGLCTAAVKYDAQSGSFSRFAVQCIRNIIQMEFRRVTQACRDYRLEAFSLDAVIPGTDVPYGDTIPDMERVEESMSFADLMEAIDERCTEREKQLIDLMLCGKKQAEIGKALGLSQPQVSRTLAAIRKKIA